MARREVRGPDGAARALTGAAFEPLRLFLASPNRVLSRRAIAEGLRGRSWSPEKDASDMQARRLRAKIEREPSRPRRIRAVRGEV